MKDTIWQAIKAAREEEDRQVQEQLRRCAEHEARTRPQAPRVGGGPNPYRNPPKDPAIEEYNKPCWRPASKTDVVEQERARVKRAMARGEY